MSDRKQIQLAVLNWLPVEREAELREQLSAGGYSCATLDGSDVVDKATLLRAAGAQLFDGEPPSNWSSFQDILRNDPVIGDSDHAALIWSHADRMLDSGVPDLVTALDILVGVARERYSYGNTLLIVLLGEGPNFAEREW